MKRILVFVLIGLFTFVPFAENFFYDIEKSYWANDVITHLVNDGHVKGYSDGTFRPRSKMTRAEFVTLIARVLDLEKESKFIFTDAKKHWAERDIRRCIYEGIIEKKDYKLFKPDGYITRFEVCKMLIYSNKNTKDIANSDVFLQSRYRDKDLNIRKRSNIVYILDRCKVLEGYPDNTIRLNNLCTRAEVCSLISRFSDNKYRLKEYNLKEEGNINFARN